MVSNQSFPFIVLKLNFFPNLYKFPYARPSYDDITHILYDDKFAIEEFGMSAYLEARIDSDN